MPKYTFSSPTSEMIRNLHLMKHPEGGYFVETDRQTQEIPSPYANGQLRHLATSIFYLLTYEERNGVFHMNKSITHHVLHEGRAEYTLITPGVSGFPPKVEKVVMGTNAEAGEKRQLLVGTGVWKRSAIPEEDIVSARTLEEKERTGCLITEVVVPGFHWEDHAFLKKQELEELFKGVEGCEEKVNDYGRFLSRNV
ncbi:hypothetical protein K439DRAFT_1325203 [Ramaria rubella]|nr:hypothetical protein K439DRAFT_1325203 [Ramaria rubella]